jgi:hypothetical protein
MCIIVGTSVSEWILWRSISAIISVTSKRCMMTE